MMLGIDYKMPKVIILIINLQRSKERWDFMIKQLKDVSVPVLRIDAIDALNQNLLIEDNRYQYFSPLKRSEVACFLSHKKAWQTFLEQDADYAIVLEDDVFLLGNIDQLVKDLPNFLPINSHFFLKLFSRSKPIAHFLKKVAFGDLIYPISLPMGCQANVYTRKSAEKLLEKLSGPIFEPVDVSLQRTWDTKVNGILLTPNFVREDTNAVGGSTQTKANGNKLLRELKRPLFRAYRFVKGLYFYNLSNMRKYYD